MPISYKRSAISFYVNLYTGLLSELVNMNAQIRKDGIKKFDDSVEHNEPLESQLLPCKYSLCLNGIGNEMKLLDFLRESGFGIVGLHRKEGWLTAYAFDGCNVCKIRIMNNGEANFFCYDNHSHLQIALLLSDFMKDQINSKNIWA